MRQRARHEQVIGTISSGIEHEMTREREPTPSHHRHPRRFIELAAHATPLPARRAEGRNVGTGNGASRQSIRQAGRRTTISHHPPASEEQTDEEDGGTTATGQPSNTPPPRRANRPGIANERERSERHDKEASRQTAAAPAAANQIDASTSHARGRGTNPSKQDEKSRGEGVGRDEKDASYLYRSMGTLRIYPIQSQSEQSGKQASPIMY